MPNKGKDQAPMNRLALRIAGLAALLTAGALQLVAADTPPDAQADRDWHLYQKAVDAAPPKPYREMYPLEREQWAEKCALQLRALGLTFIETHPADPRRWNIVVAFSPDSPRFVTKWGFPDPGGGVATPVIDKEAAAAWKVKVGELNAALAKANDVPADVLDRFATREAMKRFSAALDAHGNGEPVDLASLRAALVDFATKHPSASGGKRLMESYAQLIEEDGLTNLLAELTPFVDSPSSSIAAAARAKVAFCDVASRPLDIAVTTIDDRSIDLKQLRGKVVLLAFWATWSKPSVTELLNVRSVYQVYHKKGFEVLGICLDDARFVPTETPGQNAARLEVTRKRLTRFLLLRKMLWPEYLDGKGWSNDIALKCAVTSIPAMFLLDQEGLIVTTTAHGEDLERGVRRLLSPGRQPASARQKAP